MELVYAAAAIWMSLGMIKGFIWAQQVPQFMSWWVFYRTDQNQEASANWYKKTGWILWAICFGLLTFAMFTVLGPFVIPRERMRYFGPYGSAYVAAIAAKWNNVERGVEPLEFEDWEDYQKRCGDDPERAMNALTKIPFDKLPDSIKDVITVAKGLHDMQQRDVEEVNEDEEFRKDDE